MADLQTMSNSFAGAVSPFITQLIRAHVFKCDDKIAHWLSLVVAVGCVGAAFVVSHTPFAWQDFTADVGMAFTLSQIVYHNLIHDSKPDAGDP